MQGKDKLQVALGLIEKLTLTPSTFSTSDCRGPKAVPSRQAILDAIYICAGFNIINRVADALDFDMPPARAFAGITWFLLTFGYRLLGGSVILLKKRNVEELPAGLSRLAGEQRMDPYSAKLERLKQAVRPSSGPIDPSLSLAAMKLEDRSGQLDAYLRKVAHAAYEVDDDDVAMLRRAGYTEDQIFEATVRTAVGEGLMRLEKGLAVLREA